MFRVLLLQVFIITLCRAQEVLLWRRGQRGVIIIIYYIIFEICVLPALAIISFEISAALSIVMRARPLDACSSPHPHPPVTPLLAFESVLYFIMIEMQASIDFAVAVSEAIIDYIIDVMSFAQGRYRRRRNTT